MSDTGKQRKTQAQRRAESRQAVLDSATRLFGERGYEGASLEDIANDCGLTIRPIYHYFGNKKALFAAVNEVMEARLLDSITIGGDSGETNRQNWRAFLELSSDPAFRQVVLRDSPNILGRERWASSPVMQKARAAFRGDRGSGDKDSARDDLVNRVMMAVLTEIAMAIAEADDIAEAQRESEALVRSLFGRLQREDP